MFKTILLFTIIMGAVIAQPTGEKSELNARGKRLMFYDENGDIVKTYPTQRRKPIIPGFPGRPGRPPGMVFSDEMNFPIIIDELISAALMAQLQHKPMEYMVPMSEQITQQIANDPTYMNKLMIIPANDAGMNIDLKKFFKI